ncbi:MAG: hypothetical protein Q4A78_08660 [Peptostreptococcaceae bacterium]|nr:hypothetical protein [Peptostreptococcaceae bacterium]
MGIHKDYAKDQIRDGLSQAIGGACALTEALLEQQEAFAQGDTWLREFIAHREDENTPLTSDEWGKLEEVVFAQQAEIARLNYIAGLQHGALLMRQIEAGKLPELFLSQIGF